MKATSTWINASVRRTIEIEDGPVLRVNTSSTGKKFRVELVIITYIWQNGTFTADGWSSITLTGPFLKKDGSDSTNITRCNPPYTPWHNRDESLAWLRYLVDSHRPGTDFSMTVLTDHEVEA